MSMSRWGGILDGCMVSSTTTTTKLHHLTTGRVVRKCQIMVFATPPRGSRGGAVFIGEMQEVESSPLKRKPK